MPTQTLANPLTYLGSSSSPSDVRTIGRGAPGIGRGALAAAGVMFAVCLLMNLPYLGMTPLSGTEGHRALTAHEMVVSRHWLVPMLFGRPYLAKPPLHYWLIATAETLTGRADVFVWRLPTAIEGAVLAAFVCLMTARWFGTTAGWIAGGCLVGMVALWGERQVADVDGTNTFFAGVASLCGIELLFGDSRRAWAWIAATGAAIGGILLTKGPTGLPIVVGLWGWSAARGWKSKSAARVWSPRWWAPLVIGAALFAGYVVAARLDMHRRGLPLDTSGVSEGLQSLLPTSIGQALMALLLPGTLLAFALPVSLALVFWVVAEFVERASGTDLTRQRAMAAATLIAWCVCVLAGMSNPRYAYPTLPILCPLAGAMAVWAARRGGRAGDWLRGVAIGSAITFAVAGLVLTVGAWKLSATVPAMRPALAAAAGVAALTALWTALKLQRSWRAAFAILPLAIQVSVVFGLHQSLDRTRTSGIHAGRYIRARIGDGAPIALGMGLTYKPEIFYYANARARAWLPNEFNPRHVPSGVWLFMDGDEYARWRRQVGIRAELIERAHGGKSVYHLGWYPPGAAPTSAPSPDAPG